MRTALLPASLLAAALALPCAAPAHASILVTIDKTTQRMSVAVDGATRYVWPVSTGRPGYDTPNGTFRPFRMEADHFSKEWDDAPMPHSVFFTKIGHAIHGSLDTRHLGSAASHGCVRLSPEHASTLYALVQAEGLTDTTVMVAGRTPMATADAARRRAPVESAAGAPLDIAPGYDQQAGAYYGQQPAPYGAQPQPSVLSGGSPQPITGSRSPTTRSGSMTDSRNRRPMNASPPPAYRQLPASAQRGYALPRAAAASAVLRAPPAPLQLSGRRHAGDAGPRRSRRPYRLDDLAIARTDAGGRQPAAPPGSPSTGV